MNRQQVVRIANAKNAIATIEPIVTDFLANCTKNAVPQELPTRLQVSGQVISIDAFGHVATATGRTVNAAPGEFVVEYIFRVDHDDAALEVWRCYLTSNGRLVADLEARDPICDYDNQHVAKHICGNVLLGVLESSIYTPEAASGG